MDSDYAEAWLKDRKKPIPQPLNKKLILNLPNDFGLNDLDTSLLYFLYLTGARVSESLNSSPTDLQVQTLEDGSEALTVQLLTLKNRRLKQAGHPYRTIPIPLTQTIEKQMAEVILKHADFYNQRGIKRLYPLHRATVWKHTTKIVLNIKAAVLHPKPQIIDLTDFHTNPHYYRHCRLTDLVADYNYDAFRLMKFAGWSNLKPALVYVSLNWRDLLQPML